MTRVLVTKGFTRLGNTPGYAGGYLFFEIDRKNTLTGRIWITIIKLSLFCPDGILPEGKTRDNEISSDDKTGRCRALDTEPKGPQKLSGKRTGFGRDSGERVRTEEAIRPPGGETFRSGTEAQNLAWERKDCVSLFSVSNYEKRSELLWN